MLSFLPDHSMRLRRTLPIWVGVLLFVAAVTIIVELRKHAPPEPARLLPGAEGFLYMNLKWMRRAEMANKLPPVPHDPEYEQFIQATGFHFERDLEQAAFAIHYASPVTGGERRFSEIFVAHIDGEKLRAYLKTLARSIDTYRAIDIYNIAVENRVLRVAILGVDTVAASNHNDPAVIRGIIDRSRKLASPFGGPALLRQFYKYVPQLPLPSLGWAIFKVSADMAPPSITSPVTVVASVRYLGAIHFRTEAFTRDERAAGELASQTNTFLKIFRSAEISVGGQSPDPDFKRAMDSIKIEHRKDRAVLTAILPSELIRKLVSEAPAELSPAKPEKPK
jgi:hypothetical protein